MFLGEASYRPRTGLVQASYRPRTGAFYRRLEKRRRLRRLLSPWRLKVSTALVINALFSKLGSALPSTTMCEMQYLLQHLKQLWVREKSLQGFSLAAMTALLMSCFPCGPMAKMLRLMSPLSILCSNNWLDKSPGKEKKESNTHLTSKWGNTVKDARQRELCSFPWLLTLLVDGTRTLWR